MSRTQAVISVRKKKKATTAVVKKAGVSSLKPKKLKTGKKSEETSISLSSKLNTLESLHTKSVINKKATGDHELFQIPNKILAKRPALALALLSPYRYPVDSQKLAVGVARFGGVFFVLIGAFFTLLFASHVQSGTTQLASLMTGTSGTTTNQITVNCGDALQYLATSCATVVDHTPDATFDVNGDRTALQGDVRIRIDVPHATKVGLAMFFTQTGQNFELGPMDNTSGDTWETYLPTKNFNDGTYRLKAIITNGYGVYDDVDSGLITITNYPVPQSNTVATTTNSTGDSTTTTSAAQAQASIKADRFESKDEFRFEVTAGFVDFVKIVAFHEPTARTFILGNAYKSSDSLWKYNWNAVDFAPGDYSVRAQIVKGTNITYSNSVLVKKLNSSTLTSQTTGSGVATSTIDTEIKTDATTAELAPEIDIDIQANTPLSGLVGLKIDVASAGSVTVFAKRASELTERFLGQAKKVDTDTWVYFVDTKQLPNADFAFGVRVKNTFGEYIKTTPLTKVYNAVTAPLTQTQKEEVQKLSEIATATSQPDSSKTVATTSQNTHEDQQTIPASSDAEAAERAEDGKLFETLRSAVDKELSRLAVALRMSDTEAVKRSTDALEEQKQAFLKQLAASAKREQIVERIDRYIAKARLDVEKKIQETNRLIEERTQTKASEDSDDDGVSNYDEVALFKTDPFVSDTDADGFTDGSEILSGYDPIDPRQEVLITYESPKESGIIRDDILAVTGIATADVPAGEQSAEKEQPAAIISGKALPYGFVTLYIFSTPVVVTVKTDADGTWNYRFDKELEDGTHEIYVGVTDNAGKIIAKSKPFTFVKEAEAFTSSNTTPAPLPVETPIPQSSFLSEYMVYLVLSISVVAIGLVLILLGLHLDARARKTLVQEAKPQM